MLCCVEEAPREGDGSTIIVYVFRTDQEEICIVCVVVVPGYGSNYAHQESRTQVSGAPRSPSDALSDSPTRPPTRRSAFGNLT
jgi:hypothetical protein